MYAQDVEALRVELGDAARVVCLTFERFGEGSDAPPVKGGSFEEYVSARSPPPDPERPKNAPLF